ncbi:hypothetical protein ABTC54_20060, partial [Acinetobacter baumannii]
TIASVAAQIEEARRHLEAFPCTDPAAARGLLQSLLPAGAARNALDCALWDYEAKHSDTPVAALAGIPAAKPVVTCFTLSL